MNTITKLCISGESWEWDGVRFSFLSPNKDLLNSNNKQILKRNNKSCVLKVEARQGSVLLTADIEKPVEKLLVKNSFNLLKSDIVSVPHHGSKTSSSYDFINAVNPSYAIVNRGYKNIYGHPKAQIINRYLDNNIKVFDTVNSGAVIVTLTDKKNIIEYKTTQSYFWNIN